jgi:cell division protein FtsB
MSKQDQIYYDHLQREIDLLTAKNKQLEEKVNLLEVENQRLRNDATNNKISKGNSFQKNT